MLSLISEESLRLNLGLITGFWCKDWTSSSCCWEFRLISKATDLIFSLEFRLSRDVLWSLLCLLMGIKESSLELSVLCSDSVHSLLPDDCLWNESFLGFLCSIVWWRWSFSQCLNSLGLFWCTWPCFWLWGGLPEEFLDFLKIVPLSIEPSKNMLFQALVVIFVISYVI